MHEKSPLILSIFREIIKQKRKKCKIIYVKIQKTGRTKFLYAMFRATFDSDNRKK
jgi:hypothetical protein